MAKPISGKCLSKEKAWVISRDSMISKLRQLTRLTFRLLRAKSRWIARVYQSPLTHMISKNRQKLLWSKSLFKIAIMIYGNVTCIAVIFADN